MQRGQVVLIAALLVLAGCATEVADGAEPVVGADPVDGSPPSVPEEDPAAGAPAAGAPAAGAVDDVSATTGPQADDSCADDRVDVNGAPEHELQRIVHIGSARAEQLRELRPFSNLRDLTRIPGIGEKRLSDIVEQGLACA